ncbi:PD-(D/E)XK motif protein [Demequina pelophila]|uniref:PD-(D/E)XK motif protein n=1 Tax=Demequina pelophila TaxID=1638984 RepID=UPI0009E3B2FC|nr:PD-(D/E)XK motif protein [Demequina pelophila]
MTGEPGEVSRAWRALAAEGPSTHRHVRTAALAVEIDEGPVRAGVDSDGIRHLLVPVKSTTRLRKDLDGPGLRLRRLPLEDDKTFGYFADLSCHLPELGYLFEELVDEIVAALAGAPKNARRAMNDVIDRWKALFSGPKDVFGAEKAIGLFGELTVLARLLAVDTSAHHSWTGPEGAAHDFEASNGAIEVKSSTIASGRRFRVHGLDQLDAGAGAPLHLAWFRLKRVSGAAGTGLAELANTVLTLADDEQAVRRKLAAAGFVASRLEDEDDYRFEVVEERWYNVDSSFPRLSSADLERAGVEVRVTDVEYTVDISSDLPLPLAPSAVEHRILTLLEEPS